MVGHFLLMAHFQIGRQLSTLLGTLVLLVNNAILDLPRQLVEIRFIASISILLLSNIKPNRPNFNESGAWLTALAFRAITTLRFG